MGCLKSMTYRRDHQHHQHRLCAKNISRNDEVCLTTAHLNFTCQIEWQSNLNQKFLAKDSKQFCNKTELDNILSEFIFHL